MTALEKVQGEIASVQAEKAKLADPDQEPVPARRTKLVERRQELRVLQSQLSVAKGQLGKLDQQISEARAQLEGLRRVEDVLVGRQKALTPPPGEAPSEGVAYQLEQLDAALTLLRNGAEKVNGMVWHQSRVLAEAWAAALPGERMADYPSIRYLAGPDEWPPKVEGERVYPGRVRQLEIERAALLRRVGIAETAA